MDSLSNPYYLFSPLVAVAIIIGLLILVWKKSRRDFSSQIFSTFLVSLGLWSLFTFFMRNSPDIYHAVPWEKALIAAAIPAFALYYHFTLAYTNVRVQRWVIPAIYSFLAVLVIAVATTDLAIKGMSLEHYGYAPIRGPILWLTYAPMPFLIFGGVYNLLKMYSVSSSYEERNRLLFLAVAAIFPLVGAGLDGFTDLPPASIPSNVMFCILCSVAILRYRLLDIRVVIRKGLVYLLVSVTIALPYVGILFLVVQQILKTRIESWWIHAITILFVAIILRPLYTWAQQFVDRLFYRDRYDQLRALESFIHHTQSVANLKELGLTIVKLVRGALRASSACLMLPSEGKGGLVILACDGLDEPQPGIILRSESLLVKRLKLHGSILSSKELSIIPSLQSFVSIERQNLEKLGGELYIPIKTSEGGLSGVLILGEKRGQQAYSFEDRRLLLTLADQMAMVLENARLYDSERTMRRELEKQDEQKTEFLHRIAHELKTPLTAIVSSSELLSEKSPMTERLGKRAIENIRQGAWSMDKRVAELLDLAKLQIEELKIESEPLETVSEITDIASRLHILFERKEQTLTLEMADSLPKVNGDRGKMEQILYNLLSNANKFSPTGSEIILRVSEVDRKIVIEVEDSAPVVTDEEKRKLFTPYYRSEDKDKKQQLSGLGLGLYISKKLVELHQGEIWVKSKPGKGNVFAFSLPIVE